jgi:hypothetical protein
LFSSNYGCKIINPLVKGIYSRPKDMGYGLLVMNSLVPLSHLNKYLRKKIDVIYNEKNYNKMAIYKR